MMKSCYILLFWITLIIIPFYTFNAALSEDKKYFTPLTGMEEVPPVNTNSTGIALFELVNNNINYKLNVTNLDNIKAAHIHSGEFGQNGDIVVTLFQSATPIDIMNGTLTEG